MVLRILSVNTTEVWEGVDHQHSVNESRREEAAQGQQGGAVMKCGVWWEGNSGAGKHDPGLKTPELHSNG